MEESLYETLDNAGLYFVAELVRMEACKPLEKIVLGEWEEYVGFLWEVGKGPESVVAVFDHAAVVLPPIENDLRLLVGKRVGILRTDDPARPVRVRVFRT